MKKAQWYSQGVCVGLIVYLGLSILACSSSSSSNNPPPPPTNETAFVLTTDFSSGSYSTIDLETLATEINLPATTGIVASDNDGVYFNDKIYIINRFGFDNITVLEVGDLETAVSQFSTGNGTNPQDMAFVSDTKAYVSLYGANDILIVDPTDIGNEIVGQIDLSIFLDPTDSDGVVEAGPMVIVNGYLFVAMQRLDSFSPDFDSIVAVIDTTTDTIVDVDTTTPGTQGILLTGRNPIYMRFDDTLQKIIVSAVGSYFDPTDGGVETLDPITFTAEGFITNEIQLGGEVGDAVLVDGTKGYAVIGGFSDNSVVMFDVASGDKTGDLTVTSAFIPCLALDSQDRLLVPDRTLTDPGVRLFDTATDTEVTANPLNVGLPPNRIIVFQAD